MSPKKTKATKPVIVSTGSKDIADLTARFLMALEGHTVELVEDSIQVIAPDRCRRLLVENTRKISTFARRGRYLANGLPSERRVIERYEGGKPGGYKGSGWKDRLVRDALFLYDQLA